MIASSSASVPLPVKNAPGSCNGLCQGREGAAVKFIDRLQTPTQRLALDCFLGRLEDGQELYAQKDIRYIFLFERLLMAHMLTVYRSTLNGHSSPRKKSEHPAQTSVGRTRVPSTSELSSNAVCLAVQFL